MTRRLTKKGVRETRASTKQIAIVLLIIAAMFNVSFQVLYGFSYLQSASIALKLVVIALLLQQRA